MSGSATNDRDGVEASRDFRAAARCFEVSWDAYVRDAETKKHPSVSESRGVGKGKETSPKTPKTKTKTFLLVLFAPADGRARRAPAPRRARAMALERAKHPDGEGADDARRLRFCAFARTRASRRRRRGRRTERNADGAESGLASAFGADAVFVDLVDETRSERRVRVTENGNAQRAFERARDFSPRDVSSRASRRASRSSARRWH